MRASGFLFNPLLNLRYKSEQAYLSSKIKFQQPTKTET